MKKKQTAETFQITIPVEYTTTIKVSNDFPNKRSIVQRRAVEELRRFLGDKIYLDDRIKRGRAHSKQEKK